MKSRPLIASSASIIMGFSLGILTARQIQYIQSNDPKYSAKPNTEPLSHALSTEPKASRQLEPAYFDTNSKKLIIPLQSWTSPTLPVAVVDDLGKISREFCQILDLEDRVCHDLQAILDQALSSVGKFHQEFADYHLTDDGQVDWIYVPPFDGGFIMDKLRSEFTQILGPKVTELVIHGGDVQEVLSHYGNMGIVYRFTYEDDRIIVHRGFGATKESSDSTLYSDLPDRLPVWISSLLSIEHNRDE